jgi:hypothetical protein
MQAPRLLRRRTIRRRLVTRTNRVLAVPAVSPTPSRVSDGASCLVHSFAENPLWRHVGTALGAESLWPIRLQSRAPTTRFGVGRSDLRVERVEASRRRRRRRQHEEAWRRTARVCYRRRRSPWNVRTSTLLIVFIFFRMFIGVWRAVRTGVLSLHFTDFGVQYCRVSTLKPFVSHRSAARWLQLLQKDATRASDGSWVSVTPYNKLNSTFSSKDLGKFALLARCYPVRTPPPLQPFCTNSRWCRGVCSAPCKASQRAGSPGPQRAPMLQERIWCSTLYTSISYVTPIIIIIIIRTLLAYSHCYSFCVSCSRRSTMEQQQKLRGL